MKIGSLEIKSGFPLLLAPMAGVTDLTFRALCREQGADLTCTEMISAKALLYNNKNTFDLLKKADGESPAAVQLFGSDPEIMAEAAARLEDDFDIIDVNMGCPVAKVVGNGEGSALMKEPELAVGIISAMVRVTRRPVTVKIRSGFDADHINAPEFAKRLEDAGAAAITVHGRTRDQLYRGRADRGVIRRVKEAVSIPVIGNGDVFSGEDAASMKEECGVDAVMIARGAQGCPWIFREAAAALDGRPAPAAPTIDERRDMLLAHLRGLIADKGEERAVLEMRKHAAWYTAGLSGSAAFRRRVCELTTAADMERETKAFFCSAFL